MPVPDYQALMRPVLQALADAGPNTPSPLADVRARIIDAEGLTPDDLSDNLANGASVFVNRVSWAEIHMERAGLVEWVGRRVYRVADEGQRLQLASLLVQYNSGCSAIPSGSAITRLGRDHSVLRRTGSFAPMVARPAPGGNASGGERRAASNRRRTAGPRFRSRSATGIIANVSVGCAQAGPLIEALRDGHVPIVPSHP